MDKKKLIHYCDRCAHHNGLPIQMDKHVKSTCQLCNNFIGPLNETVEDDHVPNNISTEEIKVGAFKIQQLPGFLPGLNPKNIHPNLPYDIKSQDLVIYYPSIDDDPKSRKTLIITNPKRGEQFKIIVPGRRRNNSD